MERRSLLAHLALAQRLSSHPENLATESLNYILNRSPVAKGAFVRYVAQMGIDLPADLMFRTQESGSDDAIPDLIGFDRQGRQALVVVGEIRRPVDREGGRPGAAPGRP